MPTATPISLDEFEPAYLKLRILGRGNEKSIEELADMMLHLQSIGCRNINVVTPTHYTPHIVKALDIAAGRVVDRARELGLTQLDVASVDWLSGG
jgi:hypothetical protein